MTRIAPCLALALLGLTGCGADSVREASAQQLPATQRSASDMRPASGPQQAYELRRVWSGSDFNFYWNEPSPDGRYISEIDWSTGNLAVRDLMTGEMVRVTKDETGQTYPYGSVFSPDGKRLAYRWFNGEGEYELRTVGLDGSDQRVLVRVRPDVTSILPTDWSPDGRHILAAVERPDNTVQLALIAIADGSMQVLKSLDWQWPAEALLSPDGRYVAYSIHQPSSAADADPPDLRILAVDGSREVTVAPHEGPQRMLGWTPNGGAVLFYRREGTSGSIWMAAIQDGRQVGEPVLIESDVRVSSIGFSRDAYFFGTQVESRQLHTATIDPIAGGFLVAPRPLEDPAGTHASLGTWSPDGGQLAYLGSRAGEMTLVIRAADGGEKREIPVPLRGVGDVMWPPDGGSVLLAGHGIGRRNVGLAIYRVDLASGDVTFLADYGELPGGFAVAPNGRSLFIARRPGIVKHDLSTGEETVIYENPPGEEPINARPTTNLSVSPDGTMLGFTSGREELTTQGSVETSTSSQLLVMPIGGGDVREIYRVYWPDWLPGRMNLSWTADGRSLQFARWDGRREIRFLSRIAIDGGVLQDLIEFDCALGDCQGGQLSVHPDGRRIAFARGKNKGEIWMMTGFGVGAAAAGTSQGR